MPITVIGHPDPSVTKNVDTEPVEKLLEEKDFIRFSTMIHHLNTEQLKTLAGSLFVKNEELSKRSGIEARLAYAVKLSKFIDEQIAEDMTEFVKVIEGEEK